MKTINEKQMTDSPATSANNEWIFQPAQLVKFAVILVLALAASQLPIAELTVAQRFMLGIFVAAAGLWATEAIPPFATAILVIVLQVYLLGLPDGIVGAGFQVFINPIASPVLVLFFGGFILAMAATKHGLDQRMASAFLRPFGRRPSILLLGIILVTAMFSMFMSNTATTAMMIAIMAPFYRNFDASRPFAIALILAVPFAANIGGIGTVIGTPPNAVAASILSGMGHPISFIHWMGIGVPVALTLLLVLWRLLLYFYPPDVKQMEMQFGVPLAVGPRLIIVSGTFAVTVLLWMTEPLHAIPAAVAAMLPVAVFTLTGIITAKDLKQIDWDVLILVAGGLSLGVGMERTGLSTLLVELLPFGALSLTFLLVAFGAVAILLSNFMSNTSAANLLIPIAVAIAVWSPMVGAVAVALAASLAMSLPVSTPPNAIAYATGRIQTKDLAFVGSIISVIGLAVVTVGVLLLIRFTGLL